MSMERQWLIAYLSLSAIISYKTICFLFPPVLICKVILYLAAVGWKSKLEKAGLSSRQPISSMVNLGHLQYIIDKVDWFEEIPTNYLESLRKICQVSRQP
jgi:hypothetical protein